MIYTIIILIFSHRHYDQKLRHKPHLFSPWQYLIFVSLYLATTIFLDTFRSLEWFSFGGCRNSFKVAGIKQDIYKKTCIVSKC